MPVASEGKNPFDSLLDAFRQVVREEIGELKSALEGSKKKEPVKSEWMRAEELAAIYDLPKTWFEDRGREGTLRRTKPGRHMLFYKPDVDKFLVDHSEKGKGS